MGRDHRARLSLPELAHLPPGARTRWQCSETRARRFPNGEKERARETGEEAQTVPFLKRFTVFNLAQCENLPEHLAAVAPPPPPIEPKVEALIKATDIDFRIGGGRALPLIGASGVADGEAAGDRRPYIATVDGGGIVARSLPGRACRNQPWVNRVYKGAPAKNRS